MNSRAARSIHVCGIILILTAIGIPLIAESGVSSRWIPGLLLSAVCLKGLLIGEVFMGLATAPARWRWLVPGWLLSTLALIAMLRG